MKAKELQHKTRAELEAHASELKGKLYEKKMEVAMGRLKTNADIKNLKKEIAVTMTLIAKQESK